MQENAFRLRLLAFMAREFAMMKSKLIIGSWEQGQKEHGGEHWVFAAMQKSLVRALPPRAGVIANNGLSVGESAATRHHVNTQVGKLASFGKHGFSNLTQGIEAFDHGIEHDDQMLPGIKVLHITFRHRFHD